MTQYEEKKQEEKDVVKKLTEMEEELKVSYLKLSKHKNKNIYHEFGSRTESLMIFHER